MRNIILLTLPFWACASFGVWLFFVGEKVGEKVFGFIIAIVFLIAIALMTSAELENRNDNQN